MVNNEDIEKLKQEVAELENSTQVQAEYQELVVRKAKLKAQLSKQEFEAKYPQIRASLDKLRTIGPAFRQISSRFQVLGQKLESTHQKAKDELGYVTSGERTSPKPKAGKKPKYPEVTIEEQERRAKEQIS